MESTRDFGSREVSGKFFQKLICALVFTPQRYNQRTYVRYLYPLMRWLYPMSAGCHPGVISSAHLIDLVPPYVRWLYPRPSGGRFYTVTGMWPACWICTLSHAWEWTKMAAIFRHLRFRSPERKTTQVITPFKRH